MKLNLLILFLFIQLIAFSQKDSILIKGLVTSSESKPVKNAFVHLVSSEGHRYQYKTDSSGTYKFHFYPKSSFSCTLTIASDKYTSSGKYHNLGFMASKDQAVFELKAGHNYEKNFKLRDIVACETFIYLRFNLNSTVSCNDSLHSLDSVEFKRLDDVITNFFYVMKDDPGMAIELQGHASSIEKNPEALSLQRAEYVRQLLVNKGINGKRILVRGLSTQRLMVSDDLIKKAKTPKEAATLHLLNQRVTSRITGWNFKE